MVKEMMCGKDTCYQCEECGLRYREKVQAERCEAWCREHKSCNLEIIKDAVSVAEE
jgi:hypothetical protein